MLLNGFKAVPSLIPIDKEKYRKPNTAHKTKKLHD